MTWPSTQTTNSLDADSDTLQNARPEVKGLADKFNLLVAHVTAFMQGLLSSATAADARNTLDVPSKNGAGATGTSWGIGITGNAATATTAANVTRSVTGAGLATGGGVLTADRAITVPKANQAQAEAGTDDATAMTPLRVKQAIAVLAPVAGSGQSWQDVRALRVDDTIYQNLTGRQITVAVSMDDLSGNNRMYAYASTDATTWVLVQTSMSSEATRGSVCFPVPNGHYYRVNTSTTIAAWAELR